MEDDGEEALMERMYDWGSSGRIGVFWFFIIYLIIVVEMYSSVAAIYYIFKHSYLVNIRGIFSDYKVYIMGTKYIY